MVLLKWKIKLKIILNKELLQDEKGMFNAYERPVDFTNPKSISNLIEYAKTKD